MNFDLVVIGSGPGGYVAAIRASQLGMNVAVVERAELGGICLNWGCIPTKALLKSVQVYEYASHAAEYGIEVEGTVKPDLAKVVERSRNVAAGMSKGIEFLFKKNKITVIKGSGKLIEKGIAEVTAEDGSKETIEAKHIILATGARSRVIDSMPIDGEKIIGYRQALVPTKLPESMVVVGSGAIGSEFAYFYNAMGTKITLVEFLPNIVPLEDHEVCAQLSRSFRKVGIKVMVEASVQSVDTSGDLCKVTVQTKKGEEVIEAEIVLSAVGISPNVENIGLEELNIEMERGRVKVDEFYRTNVEGIYAIGDIINTPALAHVASAEALACVEKIAGLDVHPINYKNIPGCTYTTPEVSSVGMTEKAAIDAGYKVKVGKFPYTASGKAAAVGAKDGFVKLVFDEATNKLLGAHMIGANVTEMVAGLVTSRNLGVKGHDLIKSIHPHPTMSEAIMEAAAAAYGEVVHL
ncbi:MAG: dihydrolipoyl dehydrogenase [Prevotellaceae bacterium]|jgi:dihydrolipoamide dehydrogenase|nr:dihydrolipoyl dehydrogenase [Prevotellaceae bacterium]